MNKAIEEIRGTDSAELKANLADLRKEQFELRFHGSGEGEAGMNTVRSRIIRRTIARILTVLGDRDRKQAAEANKAAEAGGKN